MIGEGKSGFDTPIKFHWKLCVEWPELKDIISGIAGRTTGKVVVGNFLLSFFVVEIGTRRARENRERLRMEAKYITVL